MNSLLLSRSDLIATSELDYDDAASRLRFSGDFFFHTKFEQQPYVIFDLGEIRFAHSVAIENRTLSLQIALRAKDLGLHISSDLFNWSAIELETDQSFRKFQGTIEQNLRYLRLSLSHPGILHLRSIRVHDISPRRLTKNEMISGQYGYIKNEQFVLGHEAGFFSMCSVTLMELARHRSQVKSIDASYVFTDFKDNQDQNVWNVFFEESSEKPAVSHKEENSFGTTLLHHDTYKDLRHADAAELLEKYFTPSSLTKNRFNFLVDKYKINFSQTLAVCYRGTDKHMEVAPSSIELYKEKIRERLSINPQLRILVQTDQIQFREELLDVFGSRCFFLDEMPVTDSSTVMHKIIQKNKLDFSITLLAAVLLMAKCEYLITHTGNVAYWTVLFRGHSDHVIQL